MDEEGPAECEVFQFMLNHPLWGHIILTWQGERKPRLAISLTDHPEWHAIEEWLNVVELELLEEGFFKADGLAGRALRYIESQCPRLG